MQPHYDDRYTSMVSHSQYKYKKRKPHATICLCLNLPPPSHIWEAHFRKINWLPAFEGVESCIAITAFEY